MGGAFSSRTYGYDGRGNRTSYAADGFALTAGYDALRVDQLTSIANTAAGKLWGYTFDYDADGRVATKTGPAISSGPASLSSYASGPDAGGANDTVFKSATINGCAYNYFYDALNRRRYKSYPTGTSDEYFYDLGHQLLVDQGNSGLLPASSTPVIDEYVWLAGRAVALIRSNLTATWSRQADSVGACVRNGDGVGPPCGIYFPVNDVIGKPVLMLDAAGRVAGTGEYDPFGHVNRVFIGAESVHPYGTTNGVFATFTQPSPAGMTTDVQALLDAIDMNAQSPSPTQCTNWTTASDLLELRDSLGTVLSSDVGSGGSFAMDWTTPAGGTFALAIRNVGTCSFTPDALRNCTSTCDGIPVSRTQAGAVAGSYQYRRYQTGSSPLWTPLRFPGQYYDAETDLADNWNRYYDPSVGRYLQPEPMLQDASFVKMRAEDGLSAPDYAYASNNVLIFYDDNGLHDTNGCQYGSTCSDCAEQAAKIQAPDIRQCVVAKCQGKKVKLRCEEERKKKDECGPRTSAEPNGPRRSAAVRPREKNRVTWCEDKLTPKCQALLLVHELAHLCGWLDETNPPPGVPQKELEACKVQQ